MVIIVVGGVLLGDKMEQNTQWNLCTPKAGRMQEADFSGHIYKRKARGEVKPDFWLKFKPEKSSHLNMWKFLKALSVVAAGGCEMRKTEGGLESY